MFIAALFLITKRWKQPHCPLMDEWINKIWCVCVCVCVCTYIYTHTHTHNGISFSLKKEEHSDTCYNMGET